MADHSSYTVAENLFDSLKSFVVLGLCGRTGSGCSTAANILHQNFCDLQLPPPASASEVPSLDAEQLILYTYAKENWRQFYLIRVSALITGYLLSESPKKFAEYLNAFFPEVNLAPIRETIENFYNGKMSFRIPMYYIEKLRQDYGANEGELLQLLRGLGGILSGAGSWNLLFPDSGEKVPLNKLEIHYRKEPPFSFTVENHGTKSKFSYEYCYDDNEETGILEIKIKDMQQLLGIYEQNRKSMHFFENSFLSILLCDYVYNVLPEFSCRLWQKIGQAQRGLSTVILQDIGINLRICGRPLLRNDEVTQQGILKSDGYLTIVQRVNLCIKVLRDALQKKKDFYATLQQRKKDDGTHIYSKSLDYLEQETQNVLVAIDSIKNPFESQYLKARYSSYYLMAIYTDEVERLRRLEGHSKRLTTAEIEAIDTIERLDKYKKYLQSEKIEEGATVEPNTILKVGSLTAIWKKLNLDELVKVRPFIMQNVGQCVESADIFINNSTDNQQRLTLKWNLVRYVSLMMNPGLVLPTPVERCMQIAQVAKVNSGCISRQVGAVLTDAQFHIRSVGWNDTVAGRVPCTYRDLLDIFHHWSPSAYSDYENDDDDTFQIHLHQEKCAEMIVSAGQEMEKLGKRLPYCFKDIYNTIDGNKNQVHPRSLHAEERAFLGLADQGGASIKDGMLFSTSSPCELCSKKICYMGISKIYYVEPYSGISHKHVMSDGPVQQRPEQELFTGALGRAYTYLYTPILPKKDECEMWLGYKLDGTIPPCSHTQSEKFDARQLTQSSCLICTDSQSKTEKVMSKESAKKCQRPWRLWKSARKRHSHFN